MDATFSGYNAYYSAPTPACPYPPGSEEADDWRDGWMMARDEDVGDEEEKEEETDE